MILHTDTRLLPHNQRAWASWNYRLPVDPVLQLLAQNQTLIDRLDARFSWLTGPFHRVIHWCRRNRPQQARKNIAAHYDLGNHFYRSFLDRDMLYSSAWYQHPEMTQEDAQRAKLWITPAPSANGGSVFINSGIV
ncbi:Amine oxidase 2, flavin-containing [Pectobacterium sp. F1-1]|nr:Amine oxidase 2, flavin-containing [Pectobacterium sp. F1-1]